MRSTHMCSVALLSPLRLIRLTRSRPTLLSLLLFSACSPKNSPTPATYVSDSLCTPCHTDAARLWSTSHHALAMQPASAFSGPLDASPIPTSTGPATFALTDSTPTFTAPGAEGPHPIRYTFGVAPLQQALVEFDRGRLQCSPFAWDTLSSRFFDVSPDTSFAPDDELAWTGRYQRWNSMCAPCHSTDVEKRYDPEHDSYTTRFSEISVGCQACHGPGSRHVELANAHDLTPEHDGLTTHVRHGEQRAQLDACGPCHSLRTQITERWTHGEPFLDHFLPELLHEPAYTADGQLQGEAYEYGSFLQSKMHARGVACTDCHEPHSGKLRGEGNAVCAQCHQPTPPLNRFPTLKSKRYDAPEHTHHAVGTPGASCVACHMPAKTFMRIDERRDHSFRVPRPDLTVELGVPNTCGACHADEGAPWAVEQVRTLWGAKPAPHWSQDMARARAGDASVLPRLVDDPDVPSIVKATAFELYPPLGLRPEERHYLSSDPLVRLGALRASEGLDPRATKAWAGVLALLRDPLRAVRVEAARIAAALDENALGNEDRAAFTAAYSEFQAAQAATADLPGAHLNLGVVHEKCGEFADAEREYAKALELDPAFLPARFDLGQLLHRSKRSAEAERVFRDGIARAPDEGELHHSLGLLLAELGRANEAADALARAAELLPTDARKQYDAGLALDAAGRAKDAEAAFLRAVRLDANAPEPVIALAQHHASLGDWVRVLPYAEQAAKLLPGDAGARELVERARAEVARKTK